MKLGIEKLKGAVETAITIGKKVTEILADGHVSLLEGASLGFSSAMDAIQVVKNAKSIWDEIKDLDGAEKEELNQYIQLKFDIDNDKVERTVEDTLMLIITIANYGGSMSEIWSKKGA
jgi:hypothetical protein